MAGKEIVSGSVFAQPVSPGRRSRMKRTMIGAAQSNPAKNT